MLALISDAFVWDELTFPSPICHHSGVRGFLSRLFQLLITLAKLLYWRLFILRIIVQLFITHPRGFGRCLVAFSAAGISAVVISLYSCLLPFRLARWRATASSTSSELYSLLLHAILGHIVLLNIFVHFLAGVLCSPGHVPPLSPLSPHIPRTMCSRCLRPRPWRAHHCVVCGVCVLRMDHHCPWLNNCVGLRTHRHFFLFLTHLGIGIVYLYVAGFGDFMEHSRLSHRINCLVHTIVCALYRVSILVLVFVVGLLLWHGRLIGRGETSVEYYQNQKLARAFSKHHIVYHNPFDFGSRVNWLRFLGLEAPADSRVVKEKGTYGGIKTLAKRFFFHVLLPFNSSPYDGDGMEFEMYEPDVEDVLRDLRTFDE
ncbi:unnamed protein product [Hydatigera taeniaeformis]|uniref:Palmitoyltransferase n=1 Tax=Hydatigena taeniaeformis TaxID=6205 RepID=A0A0R3WJH3_HYDTA|nr:unnamed protein product [Hydatigera taeniaeformis]